MKWFTKQKRHYAALSTLVALALASSTAFAMPTGGTVTSGSLDGYTGGDLTSGASLIPTKDSIINWDSFRSELDFYGGTIEVADDVTFTEYGSSPSISLIAMQSITEPTDNSGGTEYFAATPANTISFSGKVDGLHTTDEGSFNLIGGKITVQNADIELWQKGVTQTEGVSEHKNGSEADIVALTSATGSGDDGVVTS